MLACAWPVCEKNCHFEPSSALLLYCSFFFSLPEKRSPSFAAGSSQLYVGEKPFIIMVLYCTFNLREGKDTLYTLYKLTNKRAHTALCSVAATYNSSHLQRNTRREVSPSVKEEGITKGMTTVIFNSNFKALLHLKGSRRLIEHVRTL